MTQTFIFLLLFSGQALGLVCQDALDLRQPVQVSKWQPKGFPAKVLQIEGKNEVVEFKFENDVFKDLPTFLNMNDVSVFNHPAYGGTLKNKAMQIVRRIFGFIRYYKVLRKTFKPVETQKGPAHSFSLLDHMKEGERHTFVVTQDRFVFSRTGMNKTINTLSKHLLLSNGKLSVKSAGEAWMTDNGAHKTLHLEPNSGTYLPTLGDFVPLAKKLKSIYPSLTIKIEKLKPTIQSKENFESLDKKYQLTGLDYLELVGIQPPFLMKWKRIASRIPIFAPKLRPDKQYEPGLKKTDISKIHFMQQFAENRTQDGKYLVTETARDLKEGKLEASDLPPIEVWKDSDGKIWTLDHRRLMAFNLAGLKEVQVQFVDQKQLKKEGFKMTNPYLGQKMILLLNDNYGISVTNGLYHRENRTD